MADIQDDSSPNSVALYVLSGQILPAWEVTDATKPGPWECPSEHCDLVLTHVKGKRAFNGPSAVWEKASFFRRKHPGTLHSANCDVHQRDAEEMAKSRSRSGNVKRDDIVLLELGIHPDTPVRVPQEISQTSGTPQGADYAARVNTVRLLIDMIENVGEDRLRQLFFRHNGTNYEWDQFSYRAKHSDYQRLHDNVRERVNEDRYRPWLIRGEISTELTPVALRPNRYFVTISANQYARAPKVRVFLTLAPGFRAVADDWVPGAAVAVLISEIELSDLTLGVMGTLATPDDLVLI